MLGDEFGRTSTGAALVCSATAGGLAAGLPLHIMPAPMLAATGLAMFLEGKELRYYCMFVVGPQCQLPVLCLMAPDVLCHVLDHTSVCIGFRWLKGCGQCTC